MPNPSMPLERFQFFQQRLGLEAGSVSVFAPYLPALLAHRDAYADHFYDYLAGMETTRRLLELEERRGGLKKNWRAWYEIFFTRGFDEGFLAFLWHSGILHVERGVDQRWINLGYCLTRGFMENVVREVVPESERPAAESTMHKMLDLCLMVATDAYLAATTQCDLEVMDGIAHQIRNPTMVIGGVVRGLKRSEAEGSQTWQRLDSIYLEAERLERMAKDIGEYISIFRKPPDIAPVDLEDVLAEARSRLAREGFSSNGCIDADFTQGKTVLADRGFLVVLLDHLLQNSIEGLPAPPVAGGCASATISLRSFQAVGSPSFLVLEVFNPGTPPPNDQLDALFTPFYSSKATGSGFGLPIVRLVARKCQGDVILVPEPERGTSVRVMLPRPVNG